MDESRFIIWKAAIFDSLAVCSIAQFLRVFGVCEASVHAVVSCCALVVDVASMVAVVDQSYGTSV